MKLNLKFSAVALITIALIIVTCKKEEMISRDFPRVTTLEVIDIDSTGAVFTGELFSFGQERVIDCGFVWGETSTSFPSTEYVSLGSLEKKEKFNFRIDHSLATKKKYTVKAYVKTIKYTVYGKEVEFMSLGSLAPKIIDYWPDSAKLGETIYFKCKNLSKLAYGNYIIFGNTTNSGQIINDSIVSSTVPPGIDTSVVKIGITVSGNSSYHPKRLKLILPKIYGISKNTGYWGDTVIIKGKGFASKNYNIVKFNNTQVPLINWSDSVLIFKVPANLDKVESDIIVGPFNEPTIKFHISKPEIISSNIDSTSTPGSVTLRIKGAKNEFTKVYFKDEILTNVKWIDSNTIEVKLTNKESGTFALKLDVLGQFSNEKKIKIINPKLDLKGTINFDFAETITLYGSNLDKVTNVYADDISISLVSKSFNSIKFKLYNFYRYGRSYNIILMNSSNYEMVYPTSVFIKPNDPVIYSISPTQVKGSSDTIYVKGTNLTWASVKINGYNTNSILDDSNYKLIKIIVSNIPTSSNNTLDIKIGNSYIVNTSGIDLKIKSPWKIKTPPPISDYFTSTYSGFSINNKGYFLLNKPPFYLYEYDPLNDSWIIKNDKFINQTPGNYTIISNNSNAYAISSSSNYDTKSANIYKYDYANNIWIDEKVIYNYYSKFVPFFISKKLYIAGLGFSGYGGTKTDTKELVNKGEVPLYNDITQFFGFSLNNLGYIVSNYNLMEYNPVSNSWLKKNEFPPLYPLTAVKSEDKVFIQSYYKGFYQYNPITNELKHCSGAPTDSPGFHFGINNKIYVWDSEIIDDGTIRKRFYEYDPTLEP